MTRRSIFTPSLLTDAYKLTHWKQYPRGTRRIHSYLESRGGAFGRTTFFGLQSILADLMTLLEYNTQDSRHEAINFSHRLFMGPDEYYNRDGWLALVERHGSKLPLEIRAVPEGTTVPSGNALMTIENTDDEFPWLTNWAETILMHVWYPTTVCTLSREIKKLIDAYAKKTGTRVNQFHLNDFGMRGASCLQAAARGGAAHLVNFAGTDNLAGIMLLNAHYENNTNDGWGHSVPASEHSTTTAWGEASECEFIEHMLDSYPDYATISVVADSYDYERFVREYICGKLKDRIKSRSGKVVVRPDSGDPARMTRLGMDMLWDAFGGLEVPGQDAVTYRELNGCVGMIYGDGINYSSIGEILQTVVDARFSVDNIVFGMGGALLQQCTRDTHRFAIKASARMTGNREWVDMWKQPATDKGKASKKGRLALVDLIGEGEGFATMTIEEAADRAYPDQLRTVYRNGQLFNTEPFTTIRERAAI